MLLKSNLLMVFLLLCTICIGQNTGINQPNPSEPLEVGGVIFTNQGGIKFPDSTIQTTAARNADANPDILEYPLQAVLVLDNFQGAYNNPSIGIFNGIPLLSQTQNIELPYSQGGGQVGVVVIDPIVIRKNLDQTTPRFFEVLANGNLILGGEIYFIGIDTAGTEFIYKKISLTSIRLLTMKNTQAFNGKAYTDIDEITLIPVNELAITVYTPNGPICFCWDFAMNADCGC